MLILLVMDVFLRGHPYGFLFATMLVMAIFSLRFIYPKLVNLFNLGIEDNYFLGVFLEGGVWSFRVFLLGRPMVEVFFDRFFVNLHCVKNSIFCGTCKFFTFIYSRNSTLPNVVF